MTYPQVFDLFMLFQFLKERLEKVGPLDVSWSHTQGIDISPWKKTRTDVSIDLLRGNVSQLKRRLQQGFRSESVFISIKQVFVINVKKWLEPTTTSPEYCRILPKVQLLIHGKVFKLILFSAQCRHTQLSSPLPGSISKVDLNMWMPVLRMSSHQGHFICPARTRIYPVPCHCDSRGSHLMTTFDVLCMQHPCAYLWLLVNCTISLYPAKTSAP